jgi:Cys-rich protein (TIGR01571 family)
MQKMLPVLIFFVALARLGDASVGFLGPEHVSLVQKKEMPVTKHTKEAGDGYKKGSPLYAKQVALEKKGEAGPAPKAPAESAKVSVTVPPTDKALDHNHWWSVVYSGEKAHMMHGLSYFFSYFTFTMLIALIWIKCAKPGRNKMGALVGDYDERPQTGVKFMYGLFSFDHCFGHHAHVILCSLCFAPLRMADTYNKEPAPLMKNFWSALIIITCLCGLSVLTFGFTSLVLVGICIYFRQKLRQKYGLESGSSTWFWDSLSWICCPLCAMAQEARQVEFVGMSAKTIS